MTDSQDPQQSAANSWRKAVALVAGIGLCLLLVTPFALAINRFDWGVALLLVAPLMVWLLLRIGKALERWARNEPDTPPPDPDFPDDPDFPHSP
jgi:hypothetical protein